MAVGGQAQLIYLSATLAQELGYFGDEGLAVSIHDFPGGAKSLDALIGGSSDVVCGFYDSHHSDGAAGATAPRVCDHAALSRAGGDRGRAGYRAH